jgi:hypothetical protein
MTDFIVVGIKYNQWKNTIWKNQIVEIEVDRSNVLNYENRQLVLINGKALGFTTLECKKIPFGCKVFARLETVKNHVKFVACDRPIDWLNEFQDSKINVCSKDFLCEVWEGSFLLSKYEDNRDINDPPLYDISDMLAQEDIRPRYLYEWLIRLGLTEEEIELEILERYRQFRSWLICNNLSEDNYGDEHIEKYDIYLEELKIKRQKEQGSEEEVYQSIINWREEQDSIEAEYGRGATVDEYGAVFNDDGEWIGME